MANNSMCHLVYTFHYSENFPFQFEGTPKSLLISSVREQNIMCCLVFPLFFIKLSTSHLNFWGDIVNVYNTVLNDNLVDINDN